MQYLPQILHLSCQVQSLPGYYAPWRVLLRNKMAERSASVSEDELCGKGIMKIYLIRFLHDIMNYQNLVSVLSASAIGRYYTDLGFDNS